MYTLARSCSVVATDCQWLVCENYRPSRLRKWGQEPRAFRTSMGARLELVQMRPVARNEGAYQSTSFAKRRWSCSPSYSTQSNRSSLQKGWWKCLLAALNNSSGEWIGRTSRAARREIQLMFVAGNRSELASSLSSYSLQQGCKQACHKKSSLVWARLLSSQDFFKLDLTKVGNSDPDYTRRDLRFFLSDWQPCSAWNAWNRTKKIIFEKVKMKRANLSGTNLPKIGNWLASFNTDSLSLN